MGSSPLERGRGGKDPGLQWLRFPKESPPSSPPLCLASKAKLGGGGPRVPSQERSSILEAGPDLNVLLMRSSSPALPFRSAMTLGQPESWRRPGL